VVRFLLINQGVPVPDIVLKNVRSITKGIKPLYVRVIEPDSGPRAYGDNIPIWVLFLDGFSNGRCHDVFANPAFYMEDNILVIH